jgi:predicted HicB family RNase H-like nuclease
MSQQKYNERTAKNIASLQPDFAQQVAQWLAKCREEGLNPYIHFGSRSIEEQRELRRKYLEGTGKKAVDPERSYHCYGRAFDWVNVTDANGGDAGLAWDDNAAYVKGTKIGASLQIVGIGSDDNDHLQDARFGTYADLPKSEFGKFPGGLMA